MVDAGDYHQSDHAGSEGADHRGEQSRLRGQELHPGNSPCEHAEDPAEHGTDQNADGGEDQGIGEAPTSGDVAKVGSRRKEDPREGPQEAAQRIGVIEAPSSAGPTGPTARIPPRVVAHPNPPLFGRKHSPNAARSLTTLT